MRCNMTFISLESFRNSDLSALRFPSEPWQEASSQDFEAVIADISLQLDHEGLNGKVQKEFGDLPNIGLPVLSNTYVEEAPEDNQENTESVSTQVHLMPDILMTAQPSVEIPTFILPFRKAQSSLDEEVNAVGKCPDLKTSDVVLSIPVKLPEAPQSEIHQEEPLSKGNEVVDLTKTSKPLRSKGLSIDLSLKPDESLILADPGNFQLEQDDVGLKARLDVLTRAEEMRPRMNVVPHDGIEYTAEWRVKISNLPLRQLKAKATEANANNGGTSTQTVSAAAKDVVVGESENPSQQIPFDSVSKEHLLVAESNTTPIVHTSEQLSVDKGVSEDNADLKHEVLVKIGDSTPTIEAPVSNTAVQVQGSESGNVLETDAKQQIACSVIEVKDTIFPKELKTLSISLNPEALGQVNVELVSDEAGKIHVNLAVLKAETFETLQQDFSQLKTILNEIGIEDGNVSLQLASGGEDHRHQKEEYVSWEDRESMLVRQPIVVTIPVEKIQTYPQRKSLKRLDINA